MTCSDGWLLHFVQSLCKACLPSFNDIDKLPYLNAMSVPRTTASHFSPGY